MINIVQYLVSPKNLFNLSRCGKRFAGHSKWANIKHDKAIKDAKRSLNFNKMRRLMSVAITEGNSANPAHNFRLAQCIERAKKALMPMSSINNLLTSAQAAKANTKSGMLEIRGPAGSILLVEYACDNFTAMKMNVNHILKKAGNWSIADSGTLHMFDHKGVVSTDMKGNLEEATDHAIQADAEDVLEYIHGDLKEFQFLCEPRSLYAVKNRLVDLGYVVTSAEIQYIPHSRVTLNDGELENLQKMYDRLADIEEIVKTHDNVE